MNMWQGGGQEIFWIIIIAVLSSAYCGAERANKLINNKTMFYHSVGVMFFWRGVSVIIVIFTLSSEIKAHNGYMYG